MVATSTHHEGRPVAVHFGAGNIGRGFIGALLAESGYHVVFADVDQKMIHELNTQEAYTVDIVEANGHHVEVVTDFEGVMSNDDEVIDHLSLPETRIVTTAVGPPVLSKIAPTIARGLRARRDANAPPVNIIGCENMVNQTDELKRHVYAHLDGEMRAYCDQHVGFANCAIDRIVPGGHDPSHPLDVSVEEFSEWAVDEKGLVAPIDPPILRMTLTNKLDAYIERKLFTLNCGHATTAYLGYVLGVYQIHEAIAHPYIRHHTHRALCEGGAALIRKHGFGEKEHDQYIDKVMTRFANPKLGDTVTRVGKQPLRKLGRHDRLLGPMYMARSFGLPTKHLAWAVAAAFLFDIPDDPESVELQQKVQQMGIEDAVVSVTGFEKGSHELSAVLEAYGELKH
ncbi:hypothetical protein PENSPDRAFT_649122 [Peniophora sp. CONT]|nr:hypothetical protein PENSPDRAFT_649122 [Peniophora sp. CONT]